MLVERVESILCCKSCGADRSISISPAVQNNAWPGLFQLNERKLQDHRLREQSLAFSCRILVGKDTKVPRSTT